MKFSFDDENSPALALVEYILKIRRKVVAAITSEPTIPPASY